jgi:ubiquinone biosynthesis protein
MFLEMIGAVRDPGRLRDIAGVLIRYGFADAVQRIHLGSALESLGEKLNCTEVDSLAHLPSEVKVRQALEELGPTFIKLGQVLSTRVDLFSPEWIAEL